MTSVPLTISESASTGIVGLDDILCGGLDIDRLYLLEGNPGTGKTILALQYLLQGERVAARSAYSLLFPKANWNYVSSPNGT